MVLIEIFHLYCLYRLWIVQNLDLKLFNACIYPRIHLSAIVSRSGSRKARIHRLRQFLRHECVRSEILSPLRGSDKHPHIRWLVCTCSACASSAEREICSCQTIRKMEIEPTVEGNIGATSATSGTRTRRKRSSR